MAETKQQTGYQVNTIRIFNPAEAYLANLSTGSGRRAQRSALNRIAKMLGGDDLEGFDWSGVRYPHVQGLRLELMQTYAPATTNRFLCALRGTLKAAWRLGMMDADDYQAAADVRSIKHHALPAGRCLEGSEISAVLQACAQDETPAGRRDAAVISLLYGCGLRRAELISLDMEHHNPETGQMLILGKGGKERHAWAVNDVAEALGVWLEVRGSAPGAIFWQILKNGRLWPRRLLPEAIGSICAKRAMEAHIAEFTPHDLRRSFVTRLLDLGTVDVLVVQRLAGHANAATTSKYDRRGEDSQRRAVAQLRVPYRKCDT